MLSTRQKQKPNGELEVYVAHVRLTSNFMKICV